MIRWQFAGASTSLIDQSRFACMPAQLPHRFKPTRDTVAWLPYFREQLPDLPPGSLGQLSLSLNLPSHFASEVPVRLWVWEAQYPIKFFEQFLRAAQRIGHRK